MGRNPQGILDKIIKINVLPAGRWNVFLSGIGRQRSMFMLTLKSRITHNLSSFEPARMLSSVRINETFSLLTCMHTTPNDHEISANETRQRTFD
jgi:hypothetical protein